MQKIIEYCPDCCEVVDEKGCNALHYTTMNEISYSRLRVSEEETEILKNARLMRNLCNEKDDDGNTPLHYIDRLAPKWKTSYNHALLEPKFRGEVDTMACNKYGQTALDVAAADISPIPIDKNKLVTKLGHVGAMLGGRILDKHIIEKKKEKMREDNLSDKLGKTLLSVATLIATVTFTAGFTLPGGMIQKGEHAGSPILNNKVVFNAFVVTDSFSFFLSLCATFTLFYSSIIGSGGPWELWPFYARCTYLTTAALFFMGVAFLTGTSAALDVSKRFSVWDRLAIIMLSIYIISAVLLFYIKVKDRLDAVRHSRSYRVRSLRGRVTDVQLSHTL